MKKMVKQGLGIVLLCLLAAAVFVACQKGDAKKTEGPVTITYYAWEDSAHKPLVDAFNASQNEIFVNAQILPSADYEMKITTLLSGRADIDAFMQKRQVDMFTHFTNGYIEPLDDYFKKTGLSLDAVNAYKDAVMIDNKIVAVPWRGASYYTYYNRKIFEKAGIPTPDVYVENGEWTWAKFAEVSKKLASGDGKVLGSTIYFWGSSALMKPSQNKKDLIYRDGTLGDGKELLEHFQMRKDLEGAKAMWPLVDMKVTKTHYSKQFYDGNVGMMLIGEWFPGQMTTGEKDGLLKGFTWKDYGITRLPCDNKEYSTMGAPTFNHVVGYSKKKDAAFKFVQWMGSAEAAEITASFGVLPAVSNDQVRAVLAKNIPDEKSLQYFLEPRGIYPQLYSKYGSRTEDFINVIQEEYLLGKLSDADYPARLEKGLKEIVATTD